MRGGPANCPRPGGGQHACAVGAEDRVQVRSAMRTGRAGGGGQRLARLGNGSGAGLLRQPHGGGLAARDG